MEAQASGQVACLDVSGDRTAIRRIIRDGMTDVRQMGANLVRSAGNGLALDEAGPSIL